MKVSLVRSLLCTFLLKVFKLVRLALLVLAALGLCVGKRGGALLLGWGW